MMWLLLAWLVVGAAVSTAWSRYVDGRWWSGPVIGFVVQVVVWPLVAAVMCVDLIRCRRFESDRRTLDGR